MPRKQLFIVPTAYQADTIRRMRGEGKTYEDIADELHVLPYRVQRMVQWMIRNGALERIPHEVQIARMHAASVETSKRKPEGLDGVPMNEAERRCEIFRCIRCSDLPLTEAEIAEKTGEPLAYVRQFLNETSRSKTADPRDTLVTRVGNRWVETKSVAEHEAQAS